MAAVHKLECQLGASADRSVLLGFAPAGLLKTLSWADVLDEEAGRGYQRRFNSAHSLDFRRYIQSPGSSTIPLTLTCVRGTTMLGGSLGATDEPPRWNSPPVPAG